MTVLERFKQMENTVVINPSYIFDNATLSMKKDLISVLKKHYGAETVSFCNGKVIVFFKKENNEKSLSNDK